MVASVASTGNGFVWEYAYGESATSAAAALTVAEAAANDIFIAWVYLILTTLLL